MNDLLSILLDFLLSPFGDRDDDRSIVGKSRLDLEAARFWKWVAAILTFAFLIGCLVFGK